MFRQLQITLENGKFTTIGIYLTCIELVEYETSKTCKVTCVLQEGIRSFIVRMTLEDILNKINMDHQALSFKEN